jgi:hypothetical protein
MAKLITIYSSDSLARVHLAKSTLLNEGIPAFVIDELSVQLIPIPSPKLMVAAKDEFFARQILQEHKFIEKPTKEIPKVLQKLNTLTARLPFMQNMILEMRLLILTGIILWLAALPVLYFLIKD